MTFSFGRISTLLAFIILLNYGAEVRSSNLSKENQVAIIIGGTVDGIGVLAAVLYGIYVAAVKIRYKLEQYNYNSAQDVENDLTNIADQAPDAKTAAQEIDNRADGLSATAYGVDQPDFTALRTAWENATIGTDLDARVTLLSTGSELMNSFKLPANYKSIIDYMIQKKIYTPGLVEDLKAQAMRNGKVLPDTNYQPPETFSTGTGSSVETLYQTYYQKFVNQYQGAFSSLTTDEILQQYQDLKNEFQDYTKALSPDLFENPDEATIQQTAEYQAKLNELRQQYAESGGVDFQEMDLIPPVAVI